jgi:hypothetical protein
MRCFNARGVGCDGALYGVERRRFVGCNARGVLPGLLQMTGTVFAQLGLYTFHSQLAHNCAVSVSQNAWYGLHVCSRKRFR